MGILRQLETCPPVCGGSAISIDHHGTWFHAGDRIERVELVRLFADHLYRDERGRHWLITPAEKVEVEVADAALLLVELRAEQEAAQDYLAFRTNLDVWVRLTRERPLIIRGQAEGGPAPYMRLDRGLEARMERSLFFELAEHATLVDGDWGVWSDQTFFRLDELG